VAANPHRLVGLVTRSRQDVVNHIDPRLLSADLVVDASGRDSAINEWLVKLGYPSAPVETVNSFSGYSTRVYARPRNFEGDWKVLGVQSRPPTNKRAGIINSIEGDRWMVTLGGSAYDYPPVDEQGFLAFARSLPTPLFAQYIEAAEPLSRIFGYRRMENRWRHFERLPTWPENLVVVGDAVCTFNPLYAQGMAVSARSAVLLQRELDRGAYLEPKRAFAALGRRFQRALARDLRVPWLMATGEDFRYPTTEGWRQLHTRVTHAYLDRVIQAAASDPVVHRTFLEVMHLVRNPLALVAPSTLARVVRPTHGGSPVDRPPNRPK
jgi:flavin-dependent dehydrogenase